MIHYLKILRDVSGTSMKFTYRAKIIFIILVFVLAGAALGLRGAHGRLISSYQEAARTDLHC